MIHPKMTTTLTLFLVSEALAAATPAYVRHPDLYQDRVVFTAEGDLFSAALADGSVRRLTRHQGDETFAHFSPDGTKIAFSGEYDGNQEIYVIPASGGQPVRLTWHPGADQCIGFTPEGAVIFRSSRNDPHDFWHLFSVSPEGGRPKEFPLGWASRIAIDPATGTYAFNRSNWERATWKRYRGGTSPAIWVGHPDKADYRIVTHFDGPSSYPMWHAGTIYFLSDQGGTANIWSMHPDGTHLTQATHETTWDLRDPAMAPDGRIVFTRRGDIQILDTSTGIVTPHPIDLPSDRFLTRTHFPKPNKTITWFDISKAGDRLLLTTRGEVFSIPVKQGVTIPVTHESPARESFASFLGPGKQVIYVTDASGEEAIATADALGKGRTATIVPAGSSHWHFPPISSPDGRFVAYADQTQSLFIVSATGGKPHKIDQSPQDEIRDYSFSPDSRYLAYVKPLRTDYKSISIYDTKDGSVHPVTGPTTTDYAPAWDPDGRYLYFISDRFVNPLLGSADLEYVLFKPAKIYLVLLARATKNPLAPLAGLPGSSEKDNKKGDKKEKKEKDDKQEAKPIVIDWDGLTSRIVPLPIDAGYYGSLAATEDALFYLSFPPIGMRDGDEDSVTGNLYRFALEKRESKKFTDDVRAFRLAPSGEKIIVRTGKDSFYATGTESIDDKQEIDLQGVAIAVDPEAEWRQIFNEGWRLMRDFVWDKEMSGLDWNGIRDKYAALLPRIATREDLNDLMGQMIGELATSHTYIWGGDRILKPEEIPTGLLGADMVDDHGKYKINRIYRGDPADAVPSPLLQPEVSARPGDYILAVNGKPIDTSKPFLAAFAKTAGRPILLTISRTPAGPGRDVVVTPVANDAKLRYVDWVRRNRKYVNKKTNGKIGYLHLPDMSTPGLVTFSTWFYPQLDREGMIVDVRWNGGGFVSQMILERFRRHLLTFDDARWGGIYAYPYRTLNGPFVIITNQYAGSDGDVFPYAIQREGLAPVIGKRSWGGVIGIRGDKPLVDQGMITQPEYAMWDPKLGWSVENHGVDPDIEIEDLPQDIARGVDAQLDKAIEVVMKLREEHPPVKPTFGPKPKKNRRAFQDELAAP